ncbi:TonB-dependent receptor plug domain-containing protein [Fibrobacterota bacterium]
MIRKPDHSLIGIICLVCVVTATASEVIRWQGVLKDSVFLPFPEVNLEILETGDSLKVMYGQAFEAALPADTLWNACFSAQERERCYELVYLGGDTVFQAEITGKDYRVHETVSPKPDTPHKTDTVLASIDSVLSDEGEEGSYEGDQTVQLRKVVLRVRRVPKRALGKSTVSAKMIKRMPGLAEADVIRSIQALPGVVASSDFSTKIYVRGGGSDQNLFLLDNGVVYSPVHFFGLFSTFLVECLDEVDFYMGGFAPEYGNRLSSVLDIKSRDGGKEEEDSWFRGSSLKISTFAGQAHTEGRQGDLRWIMAGRMTYIKRILQFLRLVNATDLDIDYEFYDLQGHLTYDLNPGENLSFSFYKGQDILDFSPIKIDWGNQVYPLNYEHRISKELKGKGTLSYSRFEQNFEVTNLIEMINGIDNYNLKYALEYSGLEGHRLKAGVDTRRLGITFIQDLKVVNYRGEDNSEFWLSSLFLQDVFSWEDLDFTMGARINHSSKLSFLSYPGFEPRLSLTYKLPHDQFLDFHTGYYLQYINSVLFSDMESINEFYYPSGEYEFNTVPPSASVLASAGYRKEKLLNDYTFSLEGYYKNFEDLLIFAPLDVPDSVQENTDARLGDFFKGGEGYSLGGEAYLRKEGSPLFGGVSYSHGLSVVLEENDANSYYPNWHQAHSLKADLAINWRGEEGIWKHKKKGRYLRSSIQIKYATGLPYTEYIGHVPLHLIDQNEAEPDDKVLLPRGPRNSSFVPAYFRWDIKWLDIGREGKWNLSWTILNVTDHKNIFLYFYNTNENPPELIEIEQFPFFPILISYDYFF